MNILLINPSIRENIPPVNFPIGLGIMAAVMLHEGHEVRVYDQNALRTTVEEMLRDLGKMDEFVFIMQNDPIITSLFIIAPAIMTVPIYISSPCYLGSRMDCIVEVEMRN